MAPRARAAVGALWGLVLGRLAIPRVAPEGLTVLSEVDEDVAVLPNEGGLVKADEFETGDVNFDGKGGPGVGSSGSGGFSSRVHERGQLCLPAQRW